jgi:hypothetical protein
MNLFKRKQKLVEEFNRNQILIQQLSQRNQQILGQIQLIEELEKEDKEKTGRKEDKKVK